MLDSLYDFFRSASKMRFTEYEVPLIALAAVLALFGYIFWNFRKEGY